MNHMTKINKTLNRTEQKRVDTFVPGFQIAQNTQCLSRVYKVSAFVLSLFPVTKHYLSQLLNVDQCYPQFPDKEY